MNGNGTAPETETTDIPTAPEWMHDFLPASCILDCQGPDCDSAARAYWQNNVGFVAPGWQAVDGRPYCTWLCVARYAALRAQDDINQLSPEEPVTAPLGKARRSRHN